jgi:iron complex transport system ATP-binding protein
MTAGYELRDVGMRFGARAALDSVNLRFEKPEMVAIAGANGAGKSTLLGVMAGLRPGHTGRCELGGVDVAKWKRAEFARRVSFVPQSLKLEFPFTAEQVVLMGRTPYGGGLFEREGDREQVKRAMDLTDTLDFADRDFRTLSGGERQRVVLASALAQDPEILLLDEPTAFLDLQHQLSVYRLLRELSRKGLLVITVTHDLNLAASYADRVVAIKKGRIAADAAPCDALAVDRIREVFQVEAEWLSRGSGRSWIAYGE